MKSHVLLCAATVGVAAVTAPSHAAILTLDPGTTANTSTSTGANVGRGLQFQVDQPFTVSTLGLWFNPDNGTSWITNNLRFELYDAVGGLIQFTTFTPANDEGLQFYDFTFNQSFATGLYSLIVRPNVSDAALPAETDLPLYQLDNDNASIIDDNIDLGEVTLIDSRRRLANGSLEDWTVTPLFRFSVVPEPATLGLIAVGLLGALRRRH